MGAKMDLSAIDTKLQRLNTNDSEDSIFSRKGSSTSVSTAVATSPRVLPKTMSFTKIHDTNELLSLGSLSLALSNMNSNGVPKSVNHLTTTPTNEPITQNKWCVILVGLPACGKSSICSNLIKDTQRQLSNVITDFKIDSFNAGNFRRKLSNFKNQTSDYFNFNNSEAKNQRETFAHIALEHLLNSLINSQINVGIFDATNSTRERREYIFDTIKEKELKSGVSINTLILHVKCTDQKLWRFNVEGKTAGPDYINKSHDTAIEDFIHRAQLYQSAFEDITKEELESYEKAVYISIDNGGTQYKIETNGFNDEDDIVLPEIELFIQNYYENYGKDYEMKADDFWNKGGKLEL